MCSSRVRFLLAVVLALFAATIFSLGLNASTISLSPPQLPSAGAVKGFEFVSFQFDLYLVGAGPECNADNIVACGNLLANDHENFTELVKKPCGSGRDPHCPNPPQYERLPAYTYEDTYTHVGLTSSDLVAATFVFSGKDAAGIPLLVTVTGGGTYTISLTDSMGNDVPLDLTLTDQIYTLNFQSNSLSSEILFTPGNQPSPAPEPGACTSLFVAATWLGAGKLRRHISPPRA